MRARFLGQRREVRGRPRRTGIAYFVNLVRTALP
jgi:hypothetical protein